MPELVAVHDLARAFGSLQAVRRVSLEVGRGQTHALVGGNGAGKTTTLRLLSGLLPADAGEGRVAGLDLRREGRRVARTVGYLAQGFILHRELSVAETLRLRAELHGVPDARAVAERRMTAAGLTPYAKRRAGALSGGWARRLQLCATLIHDPPLLLLDEPTTGLDHDAARAIWADVGARLDAGAGAVVNTHDPAEAERCTLVSVMAAGEVMAQGSPRELVARAGLAVFEVEGDPDGLHALEASEQLVAADRRGAASRLSVKRDDAPALVAAIQRAGLAFREREPLLADVWGPLLAEARVR